VDLDGHGIHAINAVRRPLLPRRFVRAVHRPAKAPRVGGRLLRVAPLDLHVDVVAPDALRARIVAALEADGMSVVHNGSSPAADIRIVAADLLRPVSVRHLRESLSKGAGVHVVVVSPGCGPLGARRAVRAGADSVVLEQELDDALAPAVRAVAAGFSAVPAVLRNGLDGPAFSHREREVLRLAINGHTNGEIATILFLAESTVKSHLSSAYRKLGAGSRKDAASLLLDPEEGLGDIVLGHES
jgi:DNA-binding NarL/FixJ family response regulator